MPTFLGNSSPPLVYNKRPIGAGGVRYQRNSIGHLEIHGKDGDIVVLSDEDVHPRPDASLETLLQVSGDPVTVSFTLANPSLAKDLHPDMQSAVVWGNVMNVTQGDIVKTSIPNFSAIKLVFTGTSTIYLMGR